MLAPGASVSHLRGMNTITIAESFAEFRTGLPLSNRWPGIDRVYLHLRLGIGPRFVPVLTAETDGGARWTYSGWRAFVLFERLANRGIERKGLEAHGMRRAA